MPLVSHGRHALMIVSFVLLAGTLQALQRVKRALLSVQQPRNRRAMHLDDAVRTEFLAAEATDAFLLVDGGLFIRNRNRTRWADAEALAAANATVLIDQRAACEHAGKEFRDGRILAAPERHVLLGRELIVGNHKRFQIAKHAKIADLLRHETA